MKLTNLHLTLVCLVLAVGGIVWAAGVATNAFASEAFSSFWWLSKNDAFATMFFVPTIIAAALMIGMYMWFDKNKPLK